MRKLVILAVVAVAVIVTAQTATGQQKRISPHETISAVIGGNRVTITYGRPYSKAPKGDNIRKIWGGLVPWDKAWRTGADEATSLLLQQPIMIGDTLVPAGAYTLYTIPSEKGTSKLAISKNLGGWGIPVNEKNDLARVDLKKTTVDSPVNQFTMAVQKSATGGVIRLTWEMTQYSVEFSNAKK